MPKARRKLRQSKGTPSHITRDGCSGPNDEDRDDNHGDSDNDGDDCDSGGYGPGEGYYPDGGYGHAKDLADAVRR